MTRTAAVPILTYHSVDDSGSVISVTPDTFRYQMTTLRDRGFHGVSLSDLVAAWEGKRELSPKSVALTFDDGFRNFLEQAAPVLREVGFGATVFAVAGRVGETNDWPAYPPGSVPRLPLLTWAELREVSALGFEVGAHGMTHRPLTELPPDVADLEIVESKGTLERGLDQPVRVFAYPYGLACALNRMQAARHFDAACGTVLGQATPTDDRACLPRIDTFYFRRRFLFRLFPTPLGRAYLGLRGLGRAVRGAVSHRGRVGGERKT